VCVCLCVCGATAKKHTPKFGVCGIFDTVFALSEEGQKSVTHNATPALLWLVTTRKKKKHKRA